MPEITGRKGANSWVHNGGSRGKRSRGGKKEKKASGKKRKKRNDTRRWQKK